MQASNPSYHSADKSSVVVPLLYEPAGDGVQTGVPLKSFHPLVLIVVLFHVVDLGLGLVGEDEEAIGRGLYGGGFRATVVPDGSLRRLVLRRHGPVEQAWRFKDRSQ